MTETHLSTNIGNDSLNLDEFQEPFRRDRSDFGGGVMMYVKGNLLAKRRTELEANSIEMLSIEIIINTYKLLVMVI